MILLTCIEDPLATLCMITSNWSDYSPGIGKISPNIGTDYGSIDMSGGDFQKTTLGNAMQKAVSDLAATLVSKAAGFKPDAGSAPVPPQ